MSVQAQPPTKKPKKLNLNMGIAYTHQVATQFVGIQLSGSNLLAIAVSAASVVAGTVTLAVQYYPRSWPLWVAAGIIGVGLAFLIEGMTLGALIRIRIANKYMKEIEEQLESEREFKPGFHPVENFFFWQKKRNATRTHRRSRDYSIPLAFIGAVASACAGGLFYHTILAGLGMWESFGLSALFALIVTGTFVSSEIFKDVQEKAIKEGFEGGALTEAAIKEETRRMSVLAVHRKIVAFLERDEAQEEIEQEARQMLKDILLDMRTPAKVSASGSPRVLAGPVIINEVVSDVSSQILPSSASAPSVREQTQSVMRPEPAPASQVAEPLPVVVQADQLQPVAPLEQSQVPVQQKVIPAPNPANPDWLTSTLSIDEPRVETGPLVDTPAWVLDAASQPALGEALTGPLPPEIAEATPLSADDNDLSEDKLAMTLQFFAANPQLVEHWNDEDDAQLAIYLGIQLPAIARFWRIKALNIWRVQTGMSTSTGTGEFSLEADGQLNTSQLKAVRLRRSASRPVVTTENVPTIAADQEAKQDNTQRILDYLATHPDATQTEMAVALGISIRTVQRRLSGLRDDQESDIKQSTRPLKVVR